MTELNFHKTLRVFVLFIFTILIVSCAQQEYDAADEPVAEPEPEPAPEPIAAAAGPSRDAEYVAASQLKAAEPDDEIDIAAHAYELLDTSSDASLVSGLLPGLHTYVLLTENNESATGLLEALFGSVRPLYEVQQEYSISQINVFHLPIRGDYAEIMHMLDPTNAAAVQDAFAYEWSGRAIRTICEASVEERACGEISEGPYLVTTMYPIQAENTQDLSPEDYLVLDLSTVPRNAWADMIEIYKSAVLEAETLPEIRTAIERGSDGADAGVTEQGEQVLTNFAEDLRRFAEFWGEENFAESVVLTVLRTYGRCWRTWDGKIVCSE